ncbi:MAG: 50S ribosomal protein L28 [Synergistaceae bacterium]|nr:50S ribosomal protein L28 [Synergistaceae bacterium]
MAKFCECCGRGPVSGNAVSHSNRHTRRRWLINLQNVKVDAGDGTYFKARVCTKCLKSGYVKRAVNAN